MELLAGLAGLIIWIVLGHLLFRRRLRELRRARREIRYMWERRGKRQR